MSAIHGGYTKDEFIEAMNAIRDLEASDLTDDDLAKIAGGEWETDDPVLKDVERILQEEKDKEYTVMATVCSSLVASYVAAISAA